MRPTYNLHKTWQDNYRDGPEFAGEFPTMEWGEPAYDFCGLKLHSPFGVGAGLLWNARWVELYARLGFSVLTTKTVRTHRYEGHPCPHVLAVRDYVAREIPTTVVAYPDADLLVQTGALVNSFGNPYVEPELWIQDFRRAKKSLARGQMLVVSITGTVEAGAGLDEFAEDGAQCAHLALEAGADALEVNLSCPNVANPAEKIYQNPMASAQVLASVRRVATRILLFVKVGRFATREAASRFVTAVADTIDAITAINSEPVVVLNSSGAPAFPGRTTAGLAGRPIKHLALEQVTLLAQIRREENYDYRIIGLGGVTRPEDFVEMRAAGADLIESVTGAMVNPYLAHEIDERMTANARV